MPVIFKQLTEELATASALTDLQVLAGFDRRDAVDALFSTLLPRAQLTSRISVAEKTQLVKLVNSGPWTPDQRKQLTTAFVHSGAPSVRKRDNQTMSNPENLLTGGDWLFLKDTSNARASKHHQLAFRLWSVGIELPSQATLFRIAALLAHCITDTII